MPRKLYNPSEILFLEGKGNYTVFYYNCGKQEVKSYTLLRYEEIFQSFFRISRNLLINPEHVENLVKIWK